jgi:hypothetical protein
LSGLETEGICGDEVTLITNRHSGHSQCGLPANHRDAQAAAPAPPCGAACPLAPAQLSPPRARRPRFQVKRALFDGGIARSNKPEGRSATPGIRSWQDLVR